MTSKFQTNKNDIKKKYHSKTELLLFTQQKQGKIVTFQQSKMKVSFVLVSVYHFHCFQLYV